MLTNTCKYFFYKGIHKPFFGLGVPILLGLSWISTANLILVGVLASLAIAPSARAETGFPFPANAEDLEKGEFWLTKKIHAGGDQKLGRDLTSARQAGKTWTQIRKGGSKSKNKDWLIYGQRIYAIAPGKVIRCWRNAHENPVGGKHPDKVNKLMPGGGNELVISEPDGSQTLYAHLKPGTIPASLCPHSQKTFPNKKSEDADVPLVQQATIKAGQYLGQVGNSGASSNPHLHIHRTKNGSAAPMVFSSVMVKGIDNLKEWSNGKAKISKIWARRKNQNLPAGMAVIAPNYRPNHSEIAKHGVPSSRYQFYFDHMSGSGYELEWIDGFEHKSKLYFNFIFVPKKKSFVTFHNIDSKRYQNEFNKWTKIGYRPYHVDSYTLNNKTLYAVIFRKDGGPKVAAYHGRSKSNHQSTFDRWTKKGYQPKVISVVSVQGKREYTGIYEKISGGSYQLKSTLTGSAYQSTFNTNSEKGRQLKYLNAYSHLGTTYFSAIWSSKITGSNAARHGLTTSNYQKEWSKWVKKGYRTKIVTGYSNGAKSLYAASWNK